MRTVFGAIVLALGIAAQPALAAEGASAMPTVAPLPAVSTISSSITSGMIGPVLTDLRLPSIALAPTAPVIGLDDASMLRRRFTGNSMMEFYPAAGSGFHLSAGSRLYSRRNFTKETEDSARGALSVTRLVGSSQIFSKSGFRKFNPVMTAGYTMALSKVMQIGVEGGAMMGRMFGSTPGLTRGAFGFHSQNGFRPNAVANLVLGMHF